MLFYEQVIQKMKHKSELYNKEHFIQEMSRSASALLAIPISCKNIKWFWPFSLAILVASRVQIYKEKS